MGRWAVSLSGPESVVNAHLSLSGMHAWEGRRRGNACAGGERGEQHFRLGITAVIQLRGDSDARARSKSSPIVLLQ